MIMSGLAKMTLYQCTSHSYGAVLVSVYWVSKEVFGSKENIAGT